jgi:hypothetical protein
MNTHDALLAEVAEGNKSALAPFADLLQEEGRPNAELHKALIARGPGVYGGSPLDSHTYTTVYGNPGTRWGHHWTTWINHDAPKYNKIHVYHYPDVDGYRHAFSVNVHDKADARQLISDLPEHVREHFETHMIPHLPDTPAKLARPDLSVFDDDKHEVEKETPTPHFGSQCMTCGIEGHKNAAGKCGVCGTVSPIKPAIKPPDETGSLHAHETRAGEINPNANIHSTIGSLHDAESQRRLSRMSQVVNPTPALKVAGPTMQSAFVPGMPQKLSKNPFDLVPPHQAGISHPVVTHTDGMPPHEKLVAGTAGPTDGKTRDVDQPPIPGPPPMHPVTQSAFPPPSRMKAKETVQKEGTKTTAQLREAAVDATGGPIAQASRQEDYRRRMEEIRAMGPEAERRAHELDPQYAAMNKTGEKPVPIREGTNTVPDKNRADMDEDNFAGPGNTFPIRAGHPEDVIHVAERLQATADPEAVKAKAIRIAHRLGLALPKTWEKPVKESSNATKNDWISAKIKTIMKDGLRGKPASQKQAVAVAEAMWRKKHGE